MQYYFHPEAEEELLAAADYYEDCEDGLGISFAREVISAIEMIVQHPKAWSVIEGKLRRCLIGRFPYGIIYAEVNGTIHILAVMNLHREPGYWKHRT